MAKKKDTTEKTAPVAKHLVLKKARVTEKAANASVKNTYVFDVAVDATKSEIAKAFQTTYKHKPVRVNITNVRAASYFRRGKLGFGSRSKKAYITVPKGVKIDLM